ncbi:MAG: 3-phosphoshikimate 1-carboxyvinyltransferase [Pseudomonadota bacterium]
MSGAIEITVPGSKSLTQRALIQAALARGRSVIINPCLCDDAFLLRDALLRMDVEIRQKPGKWEVISSGRLRPPQREIGLGNAGTAVRFLASLSALVDGTLVLDGNEAMRQRPQAELLDMLRTLGVRVECLQADEHLPVVLTGPADMVTGPVILTADHSSQHVSGLLMVAPLLASGGGLRVEVSGKAVSLPYINMTLSIMNFFGVSVERDGGLKFSIPRQAYAPAVFEIEGDASSAAMILAAGKLAGKKVVIKNFPTSDLQGDAVFPGVLEKLSGPGEVAINMTGTPDIVPPAVALALFRDSLTVLSGIAHLKGKESNRIGVLISELAKIGGFLQEDGDSLLVFPSQVEGEAELDPHGDHRMAMTFGLVGLRCAGVRVKDPGCVSKSYANFFDVLGKFR